MQEKKFSQNVLKYIHWVYVLSYCLSLLYTAVSQSVYLCTAACLSHTFSLVSAEKPCAVHWRGTAQKLVHWAAGAERTFWHCSISGADWWLQVSRPHPPPPLPPFSVFLTFLLSTLGWPLSLCDWQEILTYRKLTEHDKSPIITTMWLCVCTVQYKAV